MWGLISLQVTWFCCNCNSPIRHQTDEGHRLMWVHAWHMQWERNLTNVSLFSGSLKGFKALDGGGCLRRFSDSSSSFQDCRNEGLCGCSWLKVVLLLQPGMGGGLEAQRCRVSKTRLEGYGGLEIMKGKPHSLPWFSLWPIMRALDIREHITTTYLAAWQIDLGAWWVIDIDYSQHPNMCVYGWGRCQKYWSVRVSETDKYNDKFADNKMEIQSKLSSSRDLNLHLYRFSTSKTTLQTLPPSEDDLTI